MRHTVHMHVKLCFATIRWPKRETPNRRICSMGLGGIVHGRAESRWAEQSNSAYTTLHYMTWHYTTWCGTAWHFMTLHCTTWFYITWHETTGQCKHNMIGMAVHDITLHSIRLHFMTCHYITLQVKTWLGMSWHVATFLYFTLNYMNNIILHAMGWHDTARHDILWHAIIWFGITGHDIAWHGMTLLQTLPHITLDVMALHYIALRNLTWHGMTRYYILFT